MLLTGRRSEHRSAFHEEHVDQPLHRHWPSRYERSLFQDSHFTWETCSRRQRQAPAITAIQFWAVQGKHSPGLNWACAHPWEVNPRRAEIFTHLPSLLVLPWRSEHKWVLSPKLLGFSALNCQQQKSNLVVCVLTIWPRATIDRHFCLGVSERG